MSCKKASGKVYTVEDWLFGCVNFAVPESAVSYLLTERNVNPGMPALSVSESVRELLKADLYIWVCMGVSRQSDTKDSDNGWSHSGGGYTLSESDKERMLDYAKAVYEKNGEEFPYDDSVHIDVSSFGIMPCDYDVSGIPLPHIETL